MEIDPTKNLTYLGTWITPEPKSGDDGWPAFAVFGGARDALETYGAEAARIRSTSEYNEYANPQAKKFAALQSFTKTLLDARTARYQPLLDRVAATIATNERELTKGAPVNDARQAAIWGYLGDLDNPDVQRKIEDAVRVGDRETLSAVLGAPLCFGFIPVATDRTRYADAFLRTSNPGGYDALVDLRAALEVAQGAWDRAQSFIRADARLAAFESTGA